MVVLAKLADVRADQWSAIAAWVTVIVALVAGLVAWRQLREARRLRREQAQPYVAAYIEPGGAGPVHVDLVVRNFGATAALDVEVTITPAPRRSEQEPALQGEVRLPERFPTLVPGQEWRAYWDSIHLRHPTDLPDVHNAVITFSDSSGDRHELRYVLDWKPLDQRGYMVVRTLHDVGEALRDIRSEVKSWSRTNGRGIRVWARDGDARAERERLALESRTNQGSSTTRSIRHRLAQLVGIGR